MCTLLPASVRNEADIPIGSLREGAVEHSETEGVSVHNEIECV